MHRRREYLSLGEKLSEAASRRAFQRVADDIARDVKNAPSRRAAKAAADAQARSNRAYAKHIYAEYRETGMVKESLGFMKQGKR